MNNLYPDKLFKKKKKKKKKVKQAYNSYIKSCQASMEYPQGQNKESKPHHHCRSYFRWDMSPWLKWQKRVSHGFAQEEGMEGGRERNGLEFEERGVGGEKDKTEQ